MKNFSRNWQWRIVENPCFAPKRTPRHDAGPITVDRCDLCCCWNRQRILCPADLAFSHPSCLRLHPHFGGLDFNFRRDMELATAVLPRRRTGPSSAGCDRRFLSRVAFIARRRVQLVFTRILVGRTSSCVCSCRTSLVECVAHVHGARADVGKRTSLSHRVGTLRRLRVFSHHSSTQFTRSSKSRLALSRRITCGNALPVCIFLAAGGAHRQLGTSFSARSCGTCAAVLARAVRIRRQSRFVST